MGDQEAEWWYARVGASPRPEAGELVNVGVILGNGGAQDLEVASDLPRLQGLVTPSERHVYEEVISALRENVREGADLHTLRQTFGPQIQISEPRELYSRPDKKLRRNLRRKLLETPKESKETPAGPREQAEKEIERVVSRVVQVGYQVEERPTPSKLYEEHWRQIFPGRVSSLAYALRSTVNPEDVLVDGVVIQGRDPDYSISTGQISRIQRTFWEYRRAEQKILDVVGRRVRIVGLIFDGLSEEVPDVKDAREFVHHVWEQDVDLVVEADQDEEVERFHQALASGEWD